MSEPLPPEARLREPGRDIQWYESEAFPVSGRGRLGVLPHRFARLPNSVLGRVTDAVWDLGQHSAGLYLDFETDATRIHARWSVYGGRGAMPHVTEVAVAGLDLYTRYDGSWRWLAIGRGMQAVGQAPLVDLLARERRRYRLYLPLYAGLATLRLGLPPEARLWGRADDGANGDRAEVCVYGTSVVQGASASRPGMAYPSILGRRLDRAVINLGFSGSGKMEPAMADLLGEIDPAVYVIDCLPNLSEPLVTERYGPFIDRLRDARPVTPIVAVGGLHYPAAYLIDSHAARIASSAAAMTAAVTERVARGDTHLHLVAGDALLGDDGEATVDGTHPTDLGMSRIADAIEPMLRRLLR